MLDAIPNLRVTSGASLAQYTRFGIGGPADVLAETADEEAFLAARREVGASGQPYVVIGGGTNLIVSDDGFRGVVLRFTADSIRTVGSIVQAHAGAPLQRLVEFAVERGLKGLETLAGIPGLVGAAVYGNAGAYGHSISERVRSVRFFDGMEVCALDQAGCRFAYRESIFKHHKDWVVFSADLELEPADREALRKTADEITGVRNEKFPPTMKCAGSVFKNLLLAELPPRIAAEVPAWVVREGKIPAAFFLEQAGAKGLAKGDIRVADYHANLIYNAGAGTARDLCELIGELKSRVRGRFGLELEEEVQYVGAFSDGRL